MLYTIIGARCLYPNCQRATPNDLLVKWLNCQSVYLRHIGHWQFNKSTKMVEVNGLEPMASCVQSRRSPSWATPPGNDDRFRTAVSGFQLLNPESKSKFGMVGLDGVEPSTSRLSGVRSNQTELQAHTNAELWIRISEFTWFPVPNSIRPYIFFAMLENRTWSFKTK